MCEGEKKENRKGRYQCGRFLWIKSVPTSLAVGLHGWAKEKPSDLGWRRLRLRTDPGFNCRQRRQQLPRSAGEGRASPALGSSRDMNLETPSATSTEARKDRKHPPSTARGVCASNV